MEQWLVDHATSVSGVLVLVGLVIAWWRWRQETTPKELPPMSPQWRQSKDRYRADVRHRAMRWPLDGWAPDDWRDQLVPYF